MSATPENRAARLGAMLKVTAGHPVLSVDEIMEYAPRHLTGAEAFYLEDVTGEDLALLNACVEIEYELRAGAEATLGRLLPLVSGGEGTLTERVVSLPQSERAAALVCLYELGWIYTD